MKTSYEKDRPEHMWSWSSDTVRLARRGKGVSPECTRRTMICRLPADYSFATEKERSGIGNGLLKKVGNVQFRETDGEITTVETAEQEWDSGDSLLNSGYGDGALIGVNGSFVAGEDWLWSSAAGHWGPEGDELLRGDLEQAGHVGTWRAWLPDEDDRAVRLLRQRTRTGRPCGPAEFLERLEKLLGRALPPKKQGRKPKNKETEGRIKSFVPESVPFSG